MAIIDEILRTREEREQQPLPVAAPASSWVKELIDKRYQPDQAREIRKPVGFSFNREPFDPSSYYNALNLQKSVNVAGTNVVRQLAANKAQRDEEARQRELMGSLNGINPKFTYDEGGYPTSGVSRKYGLKGVTSNVAKAADYWGSKYGIKDVGGYREHGSVPGSDHPKGRALDFMTYKNKKQGNALANDLIQNWKQWNIKYVIWNRYIWSPGRGWRKYNGPSPHTDHVHASFNK